MGGQSIFNQVLQMFRGGKCWFWCPFGINLGSSRSASGPGGGCSAPRPLLAAYVFPCPVLQIQEANGMPARSETGSFPARGLHHPPSPPRIGKVSETKHGLNSPLFWLQKLELWLHLQSNFQVPGMPIAAVFGGWSWFDATATPQHTVCITLEIL